MKIETFKNLACIPHLQITAATEGHWHDFSRIFIVKLSNDTYNPVVLNIFERMVTSFLKIFKINYFSKIFKDRNVQILGRTELNETLKKINAHIKLNPNSSSTSIPYLHQRLPLILQPYLNLQPQLRQKAFFNSPFYT
jgi:hypothetical protein